MRATLIDAYGEVIGVLEVPNQELLDLNIPAGGTYVLEDAPPNSYYLNETWVAKPERTSPIHYWDAPGKQWVDHRTLNQVKDAQWSFVKSARQAAIEAHLVTPFGTFDADQSSQKAITDSVLMLQTLASIGQPTTIDFTLADNSTVTLDTTQMVTVGLLLGQQTQVAHAQARTLRTQIEAATTIAEVEAVTW